MGIHKMHATETRFSHKMGGLDDVVRVSTITLSYLVNGAPRGFLKPKRGIRQGDPLSPYLFVFCGEVLSRLYNRAQEKGNLFGIKVAQGCPRINHLLFANDTNFFCKANMKSYQEHKRILSTYEDVLGQSIKKIKNRQYPTQRKPLRESRTR